jgi:hypothetical protein
MRDGFVNGRNYKETLWILFLILTVSLRSHCYYATGDRESRDDISILQAKPSIFRKQSYLSLFRMI